jgi:vanillate O-demethylase ferredoxin subunit
VCGTCLTGVLKGAPDHRDAFLTEAERRRGDKMMLCVSRAKTSQLVLDL